MCFERKCKKADAIEEEHKAAHRTRDAVRLALSASLTTSKPRGRPYQEAEAAPIFVSTSCCRT